MILSDLLLLLWIRQAQNWILLHGLGKGEHRRAAVCIVIKRKPPARGDGIVRAVKGWVEKAGCELEQQGGHKARLMDRHPCGLGFFLH